MSDITDIAPALAAARAAAPDRPGERNGFTLRDCPDCGRLVRLRRLPAGVDAHCPRCDRVLRQSVEAPLTEPLALTLASLSLFLVTISLPFLQLRLLGRERSGWVESGAVSLYDQGLSLLAIVVVATVVLMPLIKTLLLTVVLLGVRLRQPPRWLYVAFRWYGHVGPWAMLEVFLFGALVSYTRLVDLAQVSVEPAAWTLGALVLLTVAIDASLDPEAVWSALARSGCTPSEDRQPGTGIAPETPRAESATKVPAESEALDTRPARKPIGCHACHVVSVAREQDRCPRCDAVLHARKPNSVARTWALIAAAAALYVPANYFPVMTIVSLGQGGPHTILGGVREFIESGFWPLALIVFLASVAVPMLKLIGLLLMLLGIHYRTARWLRQRTRLYRTVQVIGRWSMIDVFVVSVLVSLVSFDRLANIRAETGALCFAGVVILTILAAEAFDPRLMWDSAGEQA